MKKISVLIALCAVLFAGCKARLQNTDGKIKIACSNAPEYDWLLTVTGITNNNIVPTMIVKNGSGPHDFKPSETDLALIKTYDLIILNGGKSDKWILEEIAKANNPKQRVLNFMELLELNPETDDEHVWLSLNNAIDLTKVLCAEISNIDGANGAILAEKAVNDEAFSKESHFDGLLEYPQYTRPPVWMGREVPEVLLSGHHENISKWQYEQSLERTKNKRQDMYDKFVQN